MVIPSSQQGHNIGSNPSRLVLRLRGLGWYALFTSVIPLKIFLTFKQQFLKQKFECKRKTNRRLERLF